MLKFNAKLRIYIIINEMLKFNIKLRIYIIIN